VALERFGEACGQFPFTRFGGQRRAVPIVVRQPLGQYRAGPLERQGLSWQWIFWLNVPIALAAIPFVLTRIPEGYGPAILADLPGLALAAGAALGLVWGLIRANDAGWRSPSVLGLLVGGAILMIAFIGWEGRARVPMLPLQLFGSPAFSAGNAAIFLLNGALTAAVFFTAQYLQISLGHGALAAGLRLLPWGIAPLLIAPRAGALADRVGERLLVVAGMVLFSVGLGWLALVATPDATYRSMVLPMTISGVGFALAIPAVTKAVVSSVAMPDIGAASGIYSTMRQLGGAFGVTGHRCGVRGDRRLRLRGSVQHRLPGRDRCASVSPSLEPAWRSR
jgi:MFS family permease